MRSRIVMMGILFMTMMLLLAGCGGSGTTAINGGEGEQEEPGMSMTAVDLAGLPSVTVPANTSIAAGTSQTIGDVTFTCPADGDACALSQGDDGAVTSTGGAATAMLSDEARNQMNQMNMAATAMVRGLTEAIADPDGDGKFPEDDELEGRPSATMMAEAGGKLTVDEDELGKNDTNILNTIEFQSMPGASRASLRDFDVSVYQRMKDKKTDTLTVYTNVDDAGSEEFDEYYAPGGTADNDRLSADGAGASFSVGVDTDAKTIYGALTFATDADNPGYKYMQGSKIPTGAGQNRQLDDDEEFSGTFRGIPGTYTCGEATGCSLRTDEDNKLTVSTGLTFKPSDTVNDTDDKHMIQDVHPDENYLVFGYWLQEGTDRAGDTTYAVNAFYEGGEPYDGNTTILMGQATYSGEATGMYAKKALSIVDGAMVSTPSGVGQFTASANLTANFGAGGKVGTDEALMITGTISTFLDDGGNAIDGSWDLSLNAADIEQDATSNHVTFSGTTGSGGSVGQWEGQFFGVPTASTDATKDYPTSAAGKFTGHFENGHVIGAFGATKK